MQSHKFETRFDLLDRMRVITASDIAQPIRSENILRTASQKRLKAGTCLYLTGEAACSERQVPKRPKRKSQKPKAQMQKEHSPVPHLQSLNYASAPTKRPFLFHTSRNTPFQNHRSCSQSIEQNFLYVVNMHEVELVALRNSKL